MIWRHRERKADGGYSSGKVFLNTIIYTVTTLLQKALSFFLLPLYTAFLTPKDYGITGLIANFTSVLSLLFTLSLNSAVTRFYYEYKDDNKKLKDFWGTIVVYAGVSSIVFGGILTAFDGHITGIFLKNVAFYPFVFLGILNIVTVPVYTIYQTMLETRQEALNYSLNSMGNFMTGIILNVVFIAVFRMGAAGVLLANFLAALLFAVLAIYRIYRRKFINITFNPVYFKEALSYSLPLIPHMLSGVVASFFSRIFLNNSSTLYNVGLYNVGAQFGLLVDIAQSSANSAYVPWYFEMMNKGEEARPYIINMADILMRVFCIVSLCIALFTKEVICMMTTSSYHLSWIIVPTLAIAYLFKGIYYFYANTLFYNKKATRFIFIATISGSMFNILISALLTPLLGLMAPACSVFLEKALTCIVVIIMSRLIEPVDFNLMRMILYILITVFAVFIGLTLDFNMPEREISALAIVLKAAVVISMILVFFARDAYRIKPLISSFINNNVKNNLRRQG